MISIIIPAFNEEECLPQCLDSIFNLEYPREKFEVIVIDNGSTDRTREIAASYDVLLLQDSTKNVSGLRNLGARHAKGEILAFVDADCVVARDWLVNAEKYFGDLSVAAWGGPPGVPENSTWVQRAWSVLRQNQQPVEFVEWLGAINFFVRKCLFNKVGGFDESLITCEDVDLSYRLGKYGKIVSDNSLKVTHLGEAATVKEFFRKEVWRGAGNFSGVLRHGLSLKEIPSLAIPVYFGAFVPMGLIWAVININPLNLLVAFGLVMAPGIATMIKTRKKRATLLVKLQLFLLIYIYFLARTCSLFSSLALRPLRSP